ncbi:asparaginase domain-containing protein [Leucobacter chironomi]|uniref:asparaginase domain-containing protein n=1 Tax=Leucobacter chironomi TaxID=491918 RepID=UPI000429E9BE|nr:asparaginase domain-containing protein [Leucobacter chironomi]
MKRIDVLAVGGTISSVPKAGDSGVEPTLGAEAILGDRVGRPDLNLVFHDLPPLPSNWLSLADAVRIAARIDEVCAAGSEGVLVIQGTDTLDEVPFAVDLLVRARIPVACTGAMRTPDRPGADGPANIQDCLDYLAGAVAAETVVILGGMVHPAAYVRKTHTLLPDAFASAPIGPCGVMVEGSFFRHRAPVERPVLDLASGNGSGVLLLTAALGDAFAWLPGLFPGHYRGLVVAGMGNGHTNRRAAHGIAEVADRHPVVLVSRTGGFPLARQTYNYDGSEIFFARRGVAISDLGDGLKARILLSLAIGSTGSPEDALALYRAAEARIIDGLVGE